MELHDLMGYFKLEPLTSCLRPPLYMLSQNNIDHFEIFLSQILINKTRSSTLTFGQKQDVNLTNIELSNMKPEINHPHTLSNLRLKRISSIFHFNKILLHKQERNLLLPRCRHFQIQISPQAAEILLNIGSRLSSLAWKRLAKKHHNKHLMQKIIFLDKNWKIFSEIKINIYNKWRYQKYSPFIFQQHKVCQKQILERVNKRISESIKNAGPRSIILLFNNLDVSFFFI